MKLLFLDVDGVLNDHKKLPSGYCGINACMANHLNFILDTVPDVMLVISSAWRYQILMGAMTLKGFELLLLVHGIKCFGRLHGCTAIDPVQAEPDHFDTETWKRLGLAWRAKQIAAYIETLQPPEPTFAVLDDLPLDVPNFVQTDGLVGLTPSDACRVIEILTG